MQLGDALLGDLGHPRVDARVLAAITLHGGPVARWLGDRVITATVVAALGDADTPLAPVLPWWGTAARPSDPTTAIPSA